MKDPDWLINSTPREVQMEALRRSYGGFGTRDCLEDPPTYFHLHSGAARGWGHYLQMRLGKSMLLINEFELFQRDYDVTGMVIVCPNSFKRGWMLEAEASGTLSAWAIYESTKPQNADDVITQAKKEGRSWAVIINFEALRSDKAKSFIEKWTRGTKFGIGIDESVKIKDHRSLQTKAVLALAKDAFFVRNLSGKPAVQGPQDLYPQFRAIGQFNGKNFYAYRGRFCKMGGYKAKKVVGARNEDELHEILRGCSFIAKKKDWGLASESSSVIDNVEITEAQKKHYEEMDKDFVTYLNSGEVVTADVVISKLMKLTQISSGFVYHEGKAHFFEDPHKLPKMQKIVDLMEEVEGKLLVCYHYSASGDALLEALKKHNPMVIRSQQWMKKNGVCVESEKKKFNEDPSCRIGILQISAAKYGHTLVGPKGDRCETMAFYESTYSLDDRSQIEMRNTFFNQEWPNLYIDFAGTAVERNTAKALAKKESVVASVMDAYGLGN